MSTTPTTLSKLRHLYENMVNGGVRDTASAKRIAEGLLSPAIAELERAALTQGAGEAVEPVATLTDERILALKDQHIKMVGAGYAWPASVLAFARAIESAALQAEHQQPTGWITMWPVIGGGRREVYNPGPTKPSYGPELDARLAVAPVYAIPARTGWRWVPEKITVEMANAWAEAGRQAMSTNSQRYRAMIDAAPKPLPVGEEADPAQQAVAREREECAAICEDTVWTEDIDWWITATKRDVSSRSMLACAAAIRAKGTHQ